MIGPHFGPSGAQRTESAPHICGLVQTCISEACNRVRGTKPLAERASELFGRVRPASMEFARAQRTAANHDGIAHLNARPRITRALSLRTGRGGVTKMLLDRRMNQKQCATQPKPMGPGRNEPLTRALTATANRHAGAHGSSSAASTACATMCESLPAIREPRDHSQSHSVAVVARLTMKRRSDLALRRVPKRRARNAPPNHRPPQSTSRKKTWSTLRKTTWSTSRKK